MESLIGLSNVPLMPNDLCWAGQEVHLQVSLVENANDLAKFSCYVFVEGNTVSEMDLWALTSQLVSGLKNEGSAFVLAGIRALISCAGMGLAK